MKNNMEHAISFRWLILFALPTVIAAIFMNIYTSVDGIFVARFIDTDALSAINITLPMVYLVTAVGTMFGTGGNALVSKKIGEGKFQEAKEDFSLLIVTAFLFSILMAVLFFVFLEPICRFLGADDGLMPYCMDYMLPIFGVIPFTVFGTMFHMSYITVGKAKLGLMLSVTGGVLNIVLDWLFISVFGMGIAGAAIATSIGYVVPSVAGLLFFAVGKEKLLYIVKPKWRTQTLIKSCTNGASEMVSVLAFSVVTILFNNILMRLAGSNGVAALSIIWYAQGLFGGLFRGYITGISSVVSYNYGRQDKERLSRLFSVSMKTIGTAALCVTVLSFLLGGSVVSIFARANREVYEIALHGFRIVAVSFLMMSVNVFSSGWFTALNDGRTSAVLSFCRTIIFMVIPVLIMPQIFGIDGVWLSMSAGEGFSLMMSVYYFVKYRRMWTKERADL